MRRRLYSLVGAMLIAVAALAGGSARADQFRPAYLLLHQTGPQTYDVLWKVPALDEMTVLRVRPVLPEGTEELTPHRRSHAAGASVERWSIRVPDGLEGRRIGFDGISRASVDVLARYERSDGTEQVERILPMAPYFTVRASPGPGEVMLTYTKIGIEHILTGVDHLLFVLALVMIVPGTRRLLATVTAFTLAHSITLALATLGLVHVPSPPVEATIALSIVFVASEILHTRAGRPGLAARKPWVIAFSFGLLHGLGFAGALAEIGLPQNAIPLALLCFNVGVEIGQVAFIAAVLAVTTLSLRLNVVDRCRDYATTAVTYAVGSVASFWVIERIAGF